MSEASGSTHRKGEVIDLNGYRQTHRPSVDDPSVAARAVAVSVAERSTTETSLSDLYPADEGDKRSLVGAARVLLREAVQHAQAAHELFAAGDKVGSDQHVMLLSSHLQELFLCRDISEGMANVVLAVHYSLRNQRGAPLNLDQVFVVVKAFNVVRENLFLGFEQSLDIIDMLSEAGLEVEPPEAGPLTTLLLEEDVG